MPVYRFGKLQERNRLYHIRMKTLFWNIGSELTDDKLLLICEAITSEAPDIFCIAEGSHSIVDCQKMIDIFLKHKYICYYSPLFSDREELKLGYKYVRNGLKIFIKDDTIPDEPFSFGNQRIDGRIVALKTFINYSPTTFIFLHNFSKSGDELDQVDFISALNDMIRVEKILGKDSRKVIIGDFNLEPWDNILKHKKYLRTSFFQNHNSIKQRYTDDIKNYFNPIAGLIFETKINNLGGTYYSDSYGWALFDYVLFDTKDSDIFYDIITEFRGGSKLLNSDETIKKSFLNNKLDHLPIITKINN